MLSHLIPFLHNTFSICGLQNQLAFSLVTQFGIVLPKGFHCLVVWSCLVEGLILFCPVCFVTQADTNCCLNCVYHESLHSGLWSSPFWYIFIVDYGNEYYILFLVSGPCIFCVLFSAQSLARANKSHTAKVFNNDLAGQKYKSSQNFNLQFSVFHYGIVYNNIIT